MAKKKTENQEEDPIEQGWWIVEEDSMGNVIQKIAHHPEGKFGADPLPPRVYRYRYKGEWLYEEPE